MGFGFAPFGRHAFGQINDLPIAVTIAAGVGAVVIYTLEVYPATGSAVYAATESYVTLRTDSMPTVQFAGTLDKPLVYRRSIVDGSGFGRMSSGYGEIEISGQYDALTLSPLDGATVIVRQGWRGISIDRFNILFRGHVRTANIDEEMVRLFVDDDNARLEIPAQPSVYGGAGGIDGDSNVKSKRKPLALGNPANVTPPLIDAANLVYQAHDGAVTGFVHVYDRGLELLVDTTADHADYAALIAASITAGKWRSCKALGIFRLGAQPDGLVTCTLQGAVDNGMVAGGTGGASMADTASLVHYLITISGANILVDAGTIIAIKAAQPAAVGYYIGPDDNTTVREVIGDLMDGVGGFAGFRRDRSFTIGIFALPGSTPVVDYSFVDSGNRNIHLFDRKRVPMPDGVEPPPYRIRLPYSLNWTIQTDIDATIDAGTQTLFKDPYSIAISSNASLSAAIRVAHPRAQDPDVGVAFFVLSADAVAECNRRLTLYGDGIRSLYSFDAPTSAFSLNIGDPIKIKDSRFDLTSGKMLTVVELEDFAGEDKVTGRAFG